MRIIQESVVIAAVAASLFFVAPSLTRAQIVGQVQADIHHSFIVGDATLPPGHYVFRDISNTDESLMDVTRADGAAGAEFMVRQSVDSHTPRHTELIFDRFGSQEFLAHIYEAGNKNGVAVTEPSRIEQRLLKRGQKPFEHTEEQSK